MTSADVIDDEAFAPVDRYFASVASVGGGGAGAVLSETLSRHWDEIYGGAHRDLLQTFIAKLRDWQPRAQQLRADVRPALHREGVVYGMYVDLFGGSDFDAAIAHLDHVAELGCDCVWLLPVLESPMLDAGFDVADYHSARAQLGGNDGFARFLEAAHARGIGVVFDVALNHCSSSHRWFVEASRDAASPFRDFFLWSRDASEFPEARIIFRGIETSNWAPLGDEFYFHRFFSHQPDLNYRNPAVLLTMVCVFLHWAARGVDGFRLDAVPCVWKEGSCESRPQVHSIVRFLRAAIDSFRPGVFLLCEACQEPRDLVQFFGDGAECHAAYHFPMMNAIFLALARQQAAPIVEQLRALPPVAGQWWTFLRVHDELTLEMAPADVRKELYDFYCREPSWDFRNGIGVSARLADLLGGDARRICLAYSIELTLLGTPLIMYGDEIAKRNDVAFFEAELARTGIRDTRYLVRGKMDWPHIRASLAEPESTAARVFAQLRAMIGVRQRHAALFGGGAVETLDLHPGVLAYVRRQGDAAALVVNNLSAERVELVLPDALAARSSLLHDGPLRTSLEPFAFDWAAI